MNLLLFLVCGMFDVGRAVASWDCHSSAELLAWLFRRYAVVMATLPFCAHVAYLAKVDYSALSVA